MNKVEERAGRSTELTSQRVDYTGQSVPYPAKV